MDKIKIALVGAGGISQVFRIPALKRMENVELVALCDIDEAKVSFIADKFEVPNVYYDVQNLLNREKLDGLLICTPNNFHYPMALAALESRVATMVEKPLALNAEQAERLHQKAEETKTVLVVGMNNRFREDAVILKEFIENNELGTPFYIKSGWLKRWNRQLSLGWLSEVKIAGGGVIMDLGIQLIDLALWLINKPKVKNVRSHFYNIYLQGEAEDSALVVIETENALTITIEVSWRMHLENDIIYTHVFGKEGSAMLNPLRLNKELHGNLVNVTPMQIGANVDLFKKAYENELTHFCNVISGEAEPVTPVSDGVYVLKVIDAIYKSARSGKQVDL